MSHDVFISYSHKDQSIADGICAKLENNGLRCWIAPRDIGPGEDWPAAIANGISGSKMMVLVFSQNSNMSEEVSRELYLAANSKVIIIPFVIENVTPEAGKAYYLGRTHWLDAMNPPTEEQIDHLIERLHTLLTKDESAGKPAGVFSPLRLFNFGQRIHRKTPWAIPLELILLAAIIYGGISIAPRIKAAFFQVGLTSANEIDPSFYLHREDFNDSEFDGGLPPDWGLAEDWCDNMKVTQENGFMTFQAPANIKPGCNMGPGFGYMLSQIKAVEFVLGTTPETPTNHSSFAFMLAGSDNAQKSIFMICGLNGNRSGCNVKKEQQDVYNTKWFVDKPGNNYTFRIEVIDPDLLSFRFIVDGETIGEYSMQPADAPAYKDLNFNVGGGVVGMDDRTRASVYLMDYLAIEQR
jgi:hypothetical protein